jgi:hypothetical protein
MAILIGIRIKLELTDYDFTMFVVQLYQITQEQGYEELKQ